MARRFHIAQTSGDLDATIGMMGADFSNQCPETILPRAMQRGELIILRDDETGEVVAATVLDTSSVTKAVFVPFVLVRSEVPDSALALRQMLELIVTALISGEAERLVFMRNEDERNVRAINDFNQALANQNIRISLRSMGTVENRFGDGRNVTTASLFIPQDQRPDLLANLQQTVGKVVQAGVRVSNSLAANDGKVVICSGCGEKDREKDKEKEKEIGADKVGTAEGPVPNFGKVSLELNDSDTATLFAFYSQLGIQRFDPAEPVDAGFSPLV